MGRYLGWAAGVGLMLLAGAARGEVIDRVLAVVGTQVVTLSDLRAAETFGLVPAVARTAGSGEVVPSLVNRLLMLTEVERYSAPDPERPAVDRRLAEIRSAFASQEEFARAMARTAMSEERLRSIVADNLRIDAYVDQRFGAAAQPTAEEVLRYYREHPDEFTKGGRVAPFDEVQPQAQLKLGADRRRALIADWLDRMHRRQPSAGR